LQLLWRRVALDALTALWSDPRIAQDNFFLASAVYIISIDIPVRNAQILQPKQTVKKILHPVNDLVFSKRCASRLLEYLLAQGYRLIDFKYHIAFASLSAVTFLILKNIVL
jgi:hypothetical protein